MQSGITLALWRYMAVFHVESRVGHLCVRSNSLEANHPLSCVPHSIYRLYFDEKYFYDKILM